MSQVSTFLAQKRYAVVTGANKGIGLEICRQLASQGVVAVLTARDDMRGVEAIEKLKNSGISSDNLVFHQLDVTDSTSIATLSDFVKAKFGKLDILINNAGISGAIVDFDALKAARSRSEGPDYSYSLILTRTNELAEECLETNYYGVKRTIEALLPRLQSSDSPRIINVSSSMGKLKSIRNERIKVLLRNVQNLTEEILDEILKEFMKDFEDGSFVQKGWPANWSAYIVSKAVLNAYTRILARKYQSVIINSICPGYVKTDMTGYLGHLPVEEGAAGPVKLALKAHGLPSGLFYERGEVSSFE